jgi:hypothetical protein
MPTTEAGMTAVTPSAHFAEGDLPASHFQMGIDTRRNIVYIIGVSESSDVNNAN